MDKLLIDISAMAGVVAIFFIFAMLSTFFGGIGGMIVGWAFPKEQPWAFPVVTDTLRDLFSQPDLTNFQVGAILGFFGSFFKATNIINK